MMRKTLQWEAVQFERTEVRCLEQILTQEPFITGSLQHFVAAVLPPAPWDGALAEPALPTDFGTASPEGVAGDMLV